jgi:hypothetical protein
VAVAAVVVVKVATPATVLASNRDKHHFEE